MVVGQADERGHRARITGPELLGAGVEAVFLGQQHHRLHVHAHVRPLRRTQAAMDAEEEAHRGAEEVEVLGQLGEAPRPVVATDADGAIKVLAALVAPGAERVPQVGRIDLVLRLFHRRSRHHRLEPGQLLPGQGVDAPGLQIAAGRRAVRRFQDPAHRPLPATGSFRPQKARTDIRRAYGLADVHGLTLTWGDSRRPRAGPLPSIGARRCARNRPWRKPPSRLAGPAGVLRLLRNLTHRRRL